MNIIKNNNNQGFTLMEMIIATALFLIVITVSIGIFLSVTKANNRISSMQKVENEIRYILESISKKIRLGMIYYDYYEEVYGENLENPVSILALLDNADNRSYFTINGDGLSEGIIQLSLDDGNSWGNLNTEEIIVDKLDFYLFPEFDPFHQNSIIIKQPMVTIYLEAHYNKNDSSVGEIKIQTTVSSRQYKR